MFFKMYFSKIWENILVIIEVIMMIFIINVFISGIIGLYNQHHCLSALHQGDMYVLNANDKNIEQVIETVENIDDVTGVGYTISGQTKIDGDVYETIFYSPALYQLKSHVTKGDWFIEKNMPQIVICGPELSFMKSVGDILYVNDIKAEIVGIMDYAPYALSLDAWSDDYSLDMGILTIPADGYVLCNDERLLDPLGEKSYGTNIVILTDKDAKLFKKLEALGDVHNIKEYENASSRRYRIQSRMELMSGIIAVVVIMIIIEGLKRIFFRQDLTMTAVFKYCGLTKKKYVAIKTGHMTINVIIAVFVALYPLIDKSFAQMMLRGASFGNVNALISFIIVAAIMILTITHSMMIYKKL